MKVIERSHNFCNRLDHIEQKKKYYYLRHEKDVYPIRIERSYNLDNAFVDNNWKAFEDAEMKYYERK